VFEKLIQDKITEVLHGVSDSLELVIDASQCRVDVAPKFVPAASPGAKSVLYIYLVSRQVGEPGA
jgi:hypothetical protein